MSILFTIFLIWCVFKLTGLIFKICGKLIGGIFGIIGYLIVGVLAIAVFELALAVIPVIIIAGIIAIIVYANRV